MAAFSVKVDMRDVRKAFAIIRKGLTPSALDPVVQMVVEETKRRLVRRTPMKWTGGTRRRWIVEKKRTAFWSVTNTSDVMRFLEEGTKAHGPVTAKRLFIPLTKRAFVAGPQGVMRANMNAAPGAKKPYVYGVDYVLAKRVKGIKAMRIVAQHRPFAAITMKAAVRIHLNRLLQT